MAPILMTNTRITLKSTSRLLLGDEIAFGPGKADLLESIVACGSISAAGKQLGMSYRRAWVLVDTMNRCFKEPLVETVKGGSQGGGAQLTPLGLEVLGAYRELQGELRRLVQEREPRFAAWLKAEPDTNDR